jgi:excisionase family DNA binding protein
MSIEDIIDARVRVAVREEMRGAVRELLEEIRPGQPADYLTAEEAAAIARTHPETMRQWLREGRLPRHKKGREWLVRRSDLEEYLKATDKAPSADSMEARAAAILRRGGR